MKWCSKRNGWEKPWAPAVAQADATCFANAIICSRRIANGEESGQAHWTATGVSPYPVAFRPEASTTVHAILRHSTEVTISAPNLRGRRLFAGMSRSWTESMAMRFMTYLGRGFPWVSGANQITIMPMA